MEADKEQRSPSPGGEQCQPDNVTLDARVGEEREKGKEAQGSPVYSDQVETGEAVIWGEQITNTIRKLKSLTFFAVGSTPVPAPDPSRTSATSQGGILQEKGKRRAKPGQHSRRGLGAGPKKPGRRNIFTRPYSGGAESSSMGLDLGGSMGLDENGLSVEDGNSRDFVQGPFGLDDVANYECVSSEGQQVKTEVKTEEGEVTFLEAPDNEKQRKRKSNGTGEKPNNTYTEIITRALEENPLGLTVSEIYDYISTRYTYYNPTDDRWKNSVRHNLSISPYFHKGEKAKHGAGHVWTIAEDCRDIRSSRLQRRGLIPRGTAEEFVNLPEVEGIDLSRLKTESDFAVANILGNYTRACNREGVQPNAAQEVAECTAPAVAQEIEYAHVVHQEFNEESSNLFLTEVECEGIELHYDGILEEFHDASLPATQILSLDSEARNGVCLVEGSSGVADLEVPGMVLDISNYTFFECPVEQEVFFMEGDAGTPCEAVQQHEVNSDPACPTP